MNVNKILAQRFYRFFKYLRIVAVLAFILFLILNAINTGNIVLYWIVYGCLMVFFVASIQCVVLYLLAKYYQSKQ